MIANNWHEISQKEYETLTRSLQIKFQNYQVSDILQELAKKIGRGNLYTNSGKIKYFSRVSLIYPKVVIEAKKVFYDAVYSVAIDRYNGQFAKNKLGDVETVHTAEFPLY